MEVKRKKLVLIHPENKTRKGFVRDVSTRFMPIGLGIVARLTPDDWDVELFDESFEDFTYKEADLVALTAFTATAYRAYQIADVYRKKGVPVVMGGIHASMYTHEVMQYVDVVVTHDAEGAWPQVIADFNDGKLKRIYDGGYVDADKIQAPRRDIYKKYPYVYDLVQTSRGCPMGCEFCSVTHMCGKTYRERKVEDVLTELQETNGKLLFFIDDNLVNNKKGADERAINLFKGMVRLGLKKHWLSQVAISFADNEEVLKWARKAGCRLVLMGIEAEKEEALKKIRKNLNLKRGVHNYENVFSRIHKHRIAVLGTMIFGMENDTPEDLFARRDFITNSSIDSYQCTILTPLPGTVLHDRMLGNNSIINKNYPYDWQHYHCYLPVIETKLMKQAELHNVMNDIWLSLYNKKTVRKKLFRTILNTRSFTAGYWAYSSNHNYGNQALEEIINSDPEGLDSNMEWKTRKRSLFLKITDVILLAIYKVYWQRLAKLYNRQR